MEKLTPVLSVVLSFRNEREVLPALLQRLQHVLSSTHPDYELIFVNDASTDGSRDFLSAAAEQDKHLKLVNLSRRFGREAGIMAGLKYARGEGVVMMDADLQDPPEVIPRLIEKWREGADVVYTIRETREGESLFKIWLTRSAYRILRWTSQMNLPVDAGDFKLLCRRVVDEILMIEEKDPLVRGLVSWVGFKQVPVPYRRGKRFAGKSHFPVWKSVGPWNTFLSGLLSFSIWPLGFFLILGLLSFGISLVWAGVMGIRLLLGQPLSLSHPWLAGALFALGSLWVAMGFLGLYAGRIYQEVRRRPNYIVESTLGWEEREAPVSSSLFHKE